MKALEKDYQLLNRLDRSGIDVNRMQANALRRIEMTLHRWGEDVCGTSNDHYSRATVVEDDGSTWVEIYSHLDGKRAKYKAPNKERGALRRLDVLCKEANLFYYHQTDCRGVSLYVGNKPLDQDNYDREGVHCSV